MAGPPGPPRPRCPWGLGRGGGAENSRSPAEEPRGAAASPRRSPPEGVKGRGGEGKERTAAPGPLTTPPQPLHIGVPAPPARGWLLGWGPRLIHSAKGCYGPGRPDRTAAKLVAWRARIGAAPARGSRMCRGGRDPLPTPRGVLRPTPRGEAESPAPRGRPLPAEQLPVPTRSSRLPAPRPRAPAPAGAPAPACAAAAAGREGKGGKQTAAAAPAGPGCGEGLGGGQCTGARSLGCSLTHSLSRSHRRRRQRPELSSLSPSLCAGLSPHS